MAEGNILCFCRLPPDAYDDKYLEAIIRKEIPSITSFRSSRRYSPHRRPYSHTTFIMPAREFYNKIGRRDYFVIYMQICERKPEPVKIYRHRR